ncbi:MAG: L-aspartate oxidase [Leucobacter sp.]
MNLLTSTSRSGHVLIIGTGVAGFSSALAAAAAGADVTLVCAGRDLSELGGNTQLAQGGIAAAIGAGDSPTQHAADTVHAGAGLVDPAAALSLTTAGATAVHGLIRADFAVDRDSRGVPTMGMEGAHSKHRIVHAGEDRTGAALHAFLREQVLLEVRFGRITLLTERQLAGLSVRGGALRGAHLRDAAGTVAEHTADAVILATGGYAGIYPRSTTAAGVRGEGVLFAAQAGALLADLEFVQFHPTVLHETGSLVSEAVRGAGAVLLDGSGRRFMQDAHPLEDLAPRDVVSREIHRVLLERGEDAVWLDATGIERASPGSLAKRFPAITTAISAAASAKGLDWARDPIPVSPAAHYSMGGVATDLAARTSVPGLFAAGEIASTGVHGANRLASNSLLEGLVFGARAGAAAASFAAAFGPWDTGDAFAKLEQEQLLVTVTERPVAAQLASLITAAAEARTESRGAHQRSDYPSTDPNQATRRSLRAVFEKATSETATFETALFDTAVEGEPALEPRSTTRTRLKEPHPC